MYSLLIIMNLAVKRNTQTNVKYLALPTEIIQGKIKKSPYNIRPAKRLSPISTEKSSQKAIFFNSVDNPLIPADYIEASKHLLEQSFLANNIPAICIDSYIELYETFPQKKVYSFITKEITSIESGSSLLKSCLLSIKS